MPDIQYIGVTHNYISGNPLLHAPRAVGAIAGDLMITFLFAVNPEWGSPTTPSGWTVIPLNLLNQHNSTFSHAWYKYSNGSETAENWGNPGTGEAYIMTLNYRYAIGVVNPVNASLRTQGPSTDSTPDSVGITPTATQSLVVFWAGAFQSSNLIGPPSGMTQRLATAGGNTSIYAADMIHPSGSTGAKNVSAAGNDWQTIMLGISPIPPTALLVSD